MTQVAEIPVEQQLARVRRYGEILADFGRMISEVSDTDRLLQLACVQAARGIGIERSKLMRYRQAAGDLLIVAGIGWKPGVIGRLLPTQSGPTMLVRSVIGSLLRVRPGHRLMTGLGAISKAWLDGSQPVGMVQVLLVLTPTAGLRAGRCPGNAPSEWHGGRS